MSKAGPTPPASKDAVHGAPLADVLSRLDHGLVEAVGAVDPLLVTVTRVGIWDPADDTPLDGTALLMPGLDVDRPEAGKELEGAAARGAAAVAVRTTSLPDDLALVTQAAGLAVLAVDPRLSWDRVFVLFSAALASAELAAGVPAGQEPQRGDLFALADAIAAAVGGNTIIGDAQNRVLAYSNLGDPTDPWRRDTIIGRAPPDEWIQRFRDEGVYDRMRQPGEVVHFVIEGEKGFRPRRAVGVHAAGRMIGAIAVSEGDRPFDDQADNVLLDASRLAAIHLLRYESRHILREHAQGERLRAVLTGREEARDAVTRMGLPQGGPFVIVGIAARGAAFDDVEPLSRVGDFVRMRWPAGVAGAQAVVDDRLYLLLCGHVPGANVLTGTLQGIVADGGRLVGAELIAGVGDTVGSPEEIPQSRSAADAVLGILTTGAQATPVATLADVWRQVAIRDLEATLSNPEAFRLGKAAGLYRHDQEHGTVYAQSLRIFLEEMGDVSTASERLHVHPNTLRYRVRRALEIGDIELRDPVDRLIVEVQLRSLDQEPP